MVLEGAPEVNDIRHLTTLAGWVHARLTGRHVVGLCEASGIFPVDPETRTYDARMCELFDAKVAALGRDVPWNVAHGVSQSSPLGLSEPFARQRPPFAGKCVGDSASSAESVL